YRVAGSGSQHGEDTGHHAAIECAGFPAEFEGCGATRAGHRHRQFVDFGSAGFFRTGYYGKSDGCSAGGWRKEHFFANDAERVGDILHSIVTGKERTANPYACTGWQGRNIFCGAAVSGDVVTV